MIVSAISLPLGLGLNRGIYLPSIGGRRCQPWRGDSFFFEVDELPVLRADNVAKQCQVSDAGELSQERDECSRSGQITVDAPSKNSARALLHRLWGRPLEDKPNNETSGWLSSYSFVPASDRRSPASPI